MLISSNFDGGNIRVLNPDAADGVHLEIASDHQSHFFQWFYFRATGCAGRPMAFRIINAGESAYVEGWSDYQAVASYDRQEWFRVSSRYADGVLSIEHEPALDSVWYAYFAPYTMERHLDLIATVTPFEQVQYRNLGHTLDGQDMDLLTIGHEGEDDHLNCWLIARQHPGETMAQWWMEGFLDRLLESDDPVTRELLSKARFHVVPNMNPDGSRRGHLRTNAAGVNLNRAWSDASAESSPEVLLVREQMQATGVDFFLDVHGDEGLPYNFIAGAEGISGWSERLEDLTERFKAQYQAANPDFQTRHGYERDKPGTSDLRKATDWVAQNFDCLAMTLEMPFKDNADAPNPATGWSPDRCRILGASALDALYPMLGSLR